MRRHDVSGQVVLITGAARGLGAGLARRVVARGASVALVGLEPDRLQALAAELGPAAAWWEADVTSTEQVRAAVDGAVATFGGLDVVVANAGINRFGSLASIDEAAFEQVLEVNLLGCWRTFRATVPHVAARQGFLLAVSSMAAVLQSPLQAHYAASKAGVAAMTHALRIELHGTGASAGVVHPYFVETDMIRETREHPGGNAVWRGNRGGLYETVPLDVAVSGLLRAIEHRRPRTAIPGHLLPAVLAPGLVQPLVERLARLRHADYAEHL